MVLSCYSIPTFGDGLSRVCFPLFVVLMFWFYLLFLLYFLNKLQLAYRPSSTTLFVSSKMCACASHAVLPSSWVVFHVRGFKRPQ